MNYTWIILTYYNGYSSDSTIMPAYGSIDQINKSGYSLTGITLSKMNASSNLSSLSFSINHSTSLAGKKAWITNSAGATILGPFTLEGYMSTGGSYTGPDSPNPWWPNGTVIKVVLCLNGC